MENKKFVFFDLETNGLNLFYSRPFEIGYLIYHGKNLTKERQIYLNYPNYQIRPEIAKKVLYNKEIVEKQGIEPKLAFQELLEYILNSEYYIIFSNGLNYDCMVLKNSCDELGLNYGYDWLKRCYDINSLFKLYKLGAKIDNDNLLAQMFSANNYVRKGLKSNLQYMAKEFKVGMGEETDQFHGALFDSRVCSAIFFELIKRIDLK
ncbi:MAG: hypothetical protein AABY22_12030 [Nanoarchaeota archaeon]